MPPLADRETPLLLRDLMMAALRVADEPLNAVAIELFGWLGDEPVRRLADEAADRWNRPAHRLRLLRAVHRIGPAPDPSWYFHLCGLLRDEDPAIREAAARLVAELRPRGPIPVRRGSVQESERSEPR